MGRDTPNNSAISVTVHPTSIARTTAVSVRLANAVFAAAHAASSRRARSRGFTMH